MEEAGHPVGEGGRAAEGAMNDAGECSEGLGQFAAAPPPGYRHCSRKRWRYSNGVDADDAGGRCDSCGGGTSRTSWGGDGKGSWGGGIGGGSGDRGDPAFAAGTGRTVRGSMKPGFVEFFPYLNDAPLNEMDGETRWVFPRTESVARSSFGPCGTVCLALGDITQEVFLEDDATCCVFG